MPQIYHKRGDTLSLTCTWVDSTDTPIDITSYTVESKVKATNFTDTLTVTKTDPTNGEFVLSATATATESWPVSEGKASYLFCDVQFTLSGVVTSTETFQIVVLEDIT